MPSLYVLGKIKLSPWAGDDLHLICTIGLIARFAQLCAVLGLVGFLSITKWTQSGTPFKGDSTLKYCKNITNTTNFTSLSDAIHQKQSEFILTQEEAQTRDNSKEWLVAYTYLSFTIIVMDFALILAIWTASSIGTPTIPKLRNVLLRPLVIMKTLGILILNAICVAIGITLVIVNRKQIWSCNSTFNAYDIWEDSLGYDFFCVILIFQVTEVFTYICILIGHIRIVIREHLIKVLQNVNYTREFSIQNFLSICCQCCSVMTCFRLGGTKLQSITEFSDIVISFIDFMDIDFAKYNDGLDEEGMVVDVMFTDIFLAFKMLLRVQRQRQIECMKQFSDHYNRMREQQVEDEENMVVQFARGSQHDSSHLLFNNENEEYDDHAIYQVHSSGVEIDFDSLEKSFMKEVSLPKSDEESSNDCSYERKRRRHAALFKQNSEKNPTSSIHYHMAERSILEFSDDSKVNGNDDVIKKHSDDRIVIENGAHFLKYAEVSMICNIFDFISHLKCND